MGIIDNAVAIAYLEFCLLRSGMLDVEDIEEIQACSETGELPQGQARAEVILQFAWNKLDEGVRKALLETENLLTSGCVPFGAVQLGFWQADPKHQGYYVMPEIIADFVREEQAFWKSQNGAELKEKLKEKNE